MVQIQLENGWVVKPFFDGTSDGLDVYDEDDLLCEMVNCSFSDFLDEWGNINESELEEAIREQIDTDTVCDKLEEMRYMDSL